MYRGVQTADYGHKCTVLFNLAKSKNEKKALELLDFVIFEPESRLQGYEIWKL